MNVIANEQKYKKFKLTSLNKLWFLLVTKVVT